MAEMTKRYFNRPSAIITAEILPRTALGWVI
jgi:hypothetical protein